MLVRLFEGRSALIDAGGNGKIFDWLREYHVDSLDLVIATHPHRDHIGGMPHVVGPTPVALYLDNGHPFASEQWRRLEDILDTVGTRRAVATAETLPLGSVQIRILPPPPDSDGNPNNESVGALLFALVAGFVVGRYRVLRAFAYQNRGEALVSRAVQTSFGSPNYHLMNHVTLQMKDGTTQVDHILVSRFGVFVIETKDYKGWIFADASQAHWTQVLFKCTGSGSRIQ